MKKYLFLFGYESPQEWETNNKNGTDFESSNAVWVSAPSKEAALEAGCRYAEQWVAELFHSARVIDYPGWTVAGYAHWIEDNPLARFPGLALETFDEISA